MTTWLSCVLTAALVCSADIYQANGTINPGELNIKTYAGGPHDRSAQERWDMMGRIWQPYISQASTEAIDLCIWAGDIVGVDASSDCTAAHVGELADWASLGQSADQACPHVFAHLKEVQLVFQVPVMTTPGNHEIEPQGGLNKTIHTAYNYRYPMPQYPDLFGVRAHQGYCNPDDSGMGVNTPGSMKAALQPDTESRRCCQSALHSRLRLVNIALWLQSTTTYQNACSSSTAVM